MTSIFKTTSALMACGCCALACGASDGSPIGGQSAGSGGSAAGAAGTGAVSGGTGGVAGGTGGVAGTDIGGTGGTGVAGSAGVGGTEVGGTGGTGTCTPGVVTGNQVVMVGDSYLDQFGQNIQLYLEGLAKGAGALDQNETYRRYYLAGTSMGNGQIPSQFDQALGADPNIKVVVMDGGGNDVLILNPGCMTNPAPGNASCVATVDSAMAAARGMFDKMAATGVESVVYFFYPHLPAPGLLTGPKVNEMLDYAYPIVQAECEQRSAPRCYFVDTRPAFEGNPSLIGFDGVHPTPAGSEVIAGLIWSVMVQNCIAQ